MMRNRRYRHRAGADDGERSDLPALADYVLPDIWSTWMRFGVGMAQQWMSLVQPGWQLPDGSPARGCRKGVNVYAELSPRGVSLPVSRRL